MKNKKIIPALFATMLVLFVGCRKAPREKEVNKHEMAYNYKYLSELNNSKNMTRLYDDILIDLIEFDKSSANLDKCDFKEYDLKKYDLTKTEAWGVFCGIHNDFPEYFWLSNSVDIFDECIILYVDDMFLSANIRSTAQAEIDDSLNKIIDIVKNEDSIYMKTLAINDYLCAINSYDYSDLDNPNYKNHNIYGAMTGRDSVCQGYAKSFQYILNHLGIENIFVSGTTGNNEAHSWNMVKLDDGKYYNYDITLNDSESYEISEYYFKTRHKYLACGSNDFKSNHKVDSPTLKLGYSFQPPIPAVDMKSYSCDYLYKVIKADGLSYKITGYNTLELNHINVAGDIEIPEAITYAGREYIVNSIGNYDITYKSVFNANVTSLKIPKSVEYIFEEALSSNDRCGDDYIKPSLKSIEVSDDSRLFKSVDGVLYTKNLTTLIAYPSFKDGSLYYVEDECEYIAHDAFSSDCRLTDLFIGDNVKDIGNTYHRIGVFGNSLSGIIGWSDKGDNIDVVSMFVQSGSLAEYCNIIADIHISSGNTSYRRLENVIYKLSGDVATIDGITSDTSSVTILKNIILNDSSYMVKIGQDINGCCMLKYYDIDELIVDELDGYKYHENILYRKYNDEYFIEYIPINAKEVVIMDGVESLYDFKRCLEWAMFKNVEKLVIPESVHDIEMTCFNLPSLKELWLPGSISLLSYNFAYFSNNLKNIYYDGTIEAWNSIEKEENWWTMDVYKTNYININCSDGTIIIDTFKFSSPGYEYN